GHDLTRRAVAALRRNVADERLLDRVQLVAVGNALDRRNRAAVRLECEVVARADWVSVDQDLAGATDLGFAAALRPGKANPAAHEIQEHLLDRYFAAPRLPVDGHAYGHRLHGLDCFDHRPPPPVL